MTAPTLLENLRSRYRTAFSEWASEVRSQGDPVTPVPESTDASAEDRYRDLRDQLVAAMPGDPSYQVTDGPTEAAGHSGCGGTEHATSRRSFARRRKMAAAELRRRNGA